MSFGQNDLSSFARPSRSHSSSAALAQCDSISASTASCEVLHGGRLEIDAGEDLIATLVDHLALLVHHLVVLEDVLADLAVALLDRRLRTLDRLRDHLGLDRLVVGEGAAHHPRQCTGREQTHQLVVEAEVEAALAGVTLTAGATTELVVDPATVVALGAEHVEAAELADLVALGLCLLLELGEELVVVRERLGACAALNSSVCTCGSANSSTSVSGVVALLEHGLTGEPLGVAAEDDVDAATGHVGGHGDGVEPPGLADDLRLAGVLLRVEDLVRHAALVEHLRQQLALLDADRADEHRLAALVLLGDVVDDRAELARHRP